MNLLAYSSFIILVAITYTCFWNLVDMPAGIVKFGTETGEGLDDYDDGGLPSLKVAKKVKLGLSVELFVM